MRIKELIKLGMCVTSSNSESSRSEGNDGGGSLEDRSTRGEGDSTADSPFSTIPDGSFESHLGLNAELVDIVLGILRLVPLSSEGGSQSVISLSGAAGFQSLEVLDLKNRCESIKTRTGGSVDVSISSSFGCFSDSSSRVGSASENLDGDPVHLQGTLIVGSSTS